MFEPLPLDERGMDMVDLLPSRVKNFWPGGDYRPEGDLFVGIAHAESIIVVSVHPETCVFPLIVKVALC
jgi:hypothetical protein